MLMRTDPLPLPGARIPWPHQRVFDTATRPAVMPMDACVT